MRYRRGNHLHLCERRWPARGDVPDPQRLPKEIYVGTTVPVFAWINWIKFVFFVPDKIITLQTAAYSASLLSFVPLGVWIGLWLNKRISEQIFINIVYLFTFLAGLQLILK